MAGAALRTWLGLLALGHGPTGKGKAKQRRLRWMGPEWEGTTMAAQEEARNQAVFKMRRAPVEESRRRG
jgi:hypothetical protein